MAKRPKIPTGVHDARRAEEPGEGLAVVAVADDVTARRRRYVQGEPSYAATSTPEGHIGRHRTRIMVAPDRAGKERPKSGVRERVWKTQPEG